MKNAAKNAVTAALSAALSKDERLRKDQNSLAGKQNKGRLP